MANGKDRNIQSETLLVVGVNTYNNVVSQSQIDPTVSSHSTPINEYAIVNEFKISSTHFSGLMNLTSAIIFPEILRKRRI